MPVHAARGPQHGAHGVLARNESGKPRRNAPRRPHPERIRRQRDEVVIADRLVVDHVIDGAGRSPLCGIHARGGDVFDAHDIPPVVSRTDHREAARLLEPLDELLGVPPTRAVDVAGSDNNGAEPRSLNEPLAFLLGASVRGLHRERRVLIELRPASVAGDHRRREDEARPAGRCARGEEPAGSLHIHLGDPARVAL